VSKTGVRKNEQMNWPLFAQHVLKGVL